MLAAQARGEFRTSANLTLVRLFVLGALNWTVEWFKPGGRTIEEVARAAYARGARLVLTPELSICGYAAEDLFLRPAFITASHSGRLLRTTWPRPGLRLHHNPY